MGELKQTIDNDVAWLLGVITGDGHVGRYFVEISDKYRKNLMIVKKVIEQLGFKAIITKDKRENRYRLWVNSVSFVNYLKRMGLVRGGCLPSQILNTTNTNLITSYIKGLFDAEGYIELWKPRNTIRINFANSSEEVSFFVRDKLREMGLKPYFRYSSKAYRIQLYRKTDVKTYISLIGFKYPSKLAILSKFSKLLNP